MSPDLSDVPEELRDAVAVALRTVGVTEGHLSLDLVDEVRMRELNRRHRRLDRPTDVLSFPLDGVGPVAGPRELGDVVICPAHAADTVEAAVHGVLHLCGYDHETDSGEMLALQEQVLDELGKTADQRKGVGEMPSAGGENARRSGFVGLAGRPNVGKSTIANAIVGEKIAIVSDRPQTTRRAVRGVATDLGGGWQMVLVDLPGVQRPRDVLTERMQGRVERELADSDAVLLVLNGEQGVGAGDRFIARHLLAVGPRPPVVCVVNKVDRLRAPEIAKVLVEAAELDVTEEIFPVSAKRGTGLGPLIEHLATLMPEGEFLYPAEEHSDQASEVHLGELIREQVLRRTRDEIPHAVEVAVESVEEREDGLVEVRAQIWAEAESQKGILIGQGGRMVREVGTAARRELERELGTRVFLDLQVRVRERWRRDEELLDRLGID